MKRLKNKLLAMDPTTTTYKAMYEGLMIVDDPSHPGMDPWTAYEPTYYHEDIGFTITLTHKLAQDKPTVVIAIPVARLGMDLPASTIEQDAVADLCLRTFKPYIDEMNAALYNRSRPDTENGKFELHTPGGEILKRNASFFALCPQKDYENGGGSKVYVLNDDVQRPPLPCLCIRLQVQLPAKKMRRTVQMLCRDLPDAVDRFIFAFDPERYRQTLTLAQTQHAIRTWLKGSDYCAFIANGSILPRAKEGDLPLPDAIPFTSTPEAEIEICGVRGMGIRRGVTVITGGGYSGKSTLLDAISAGIYDHAAGDGRELCLTDPSAVTISAEDGRSVMHLNISPFIRWLPGGDTTDFSTDHASGSTSQAANIMEAVDSGATLLLIDEDRSATNFMIRDRTMKQLLEREPITPFTDRVRELHAVRGVSTILVIGGSGEYLSVADHIYMMEDYLIHDVTQKAKEICYAHGMSAESPTLGDWTQSRLLYSDRFTSYPEGSGTERLLVSDMGFILIGDEQIDVRAMHNIVSPRQLDALAFMLRYLQITNIAHCIDLTHKIDELYAKIDTEGLDFLYSPFFTDSERFLDLPRKQEFLCLINRMRKIHYTKAGDTHDERL